MDLLKKSFMTANKPKDQSPELSCYSCAACNEEELEWHGNLLRGRTKARSLSSSPAPGNSHDFRLDSKLHYYEAALVKRLIVYVERKVLEDPEIEEDDNFVVVKKKFCTFLEDYDDISDRVDFIICLGGDGTLLYASSLFQESVPPVMAFHLGSLGFLTPFKFESYQSQVSQVIEGNAAIVLRSRLKVKVVKEPREIKTSHEVGRDMKRMILKTGDKDMSRKTMLYQQTATGKYSRVKDCAYGEEDEMVRVVFDTNSAKLQEKVLSARTKVTLNTAMDIAGDGSSTAGNLRCMYTEWLT
ncbi:NADK kinase, partial [Polypterus senegalus]